MAKDLRFSERKSRKTSWPMKTAWIFFILSLILLCIYAITPMITRYLVVNLLEQNGMTQVNFVESRWQPWTPAIEIDQLDWLTPENKKVSIQYAELTLDWSGILHKHLTIKNLKIDQLNLPVSLQPEIIIGGFKIPTSTHTESNQTPPLPTENSWQLSLINLDVVNTQFSVEGAPLPAALIQQSHEFGIKSLNIQNFSTDDYQQKTKINFKGNLDDLKFEFATNAAPLSDTQSLEGSLNILPIGPFDQAKHWIVSELLEGIQGNGDLGLKLSLDHTNTSAGRVVNFNIDLQSPQLESEIKRDLNVPVTLKMNNVDLQLSSSITIQKNRLKLSANSNLKGSELNLESGNGLQFILNDFDLNTQLLDTRASLNALEQIQPNIESDIEFTQAHFLQNKSTIFEAKAFKTHLKIQDKSIQIPELELQQLFALNQDTPVLDQLKIENINAGRNELGEKSLQIDSVKLNQLEAFLRTNAEGEFEAKKILEEISNKINNIIASSTLEETNSSEQNTPEDVKPSFKFEWLVNDLTVTKESQISLINPEAPLYKNQDLFIHEFKAKNLSMSQPSWIKFDTRLNDSGNISGEGTFTLADIQANTDLNIHIDNLELPPLSGYIEPIIGYNIQTGSLDSQIQIKSQAGEGESFINFEAQKLEMDPADKNIIATLSKELTMPLDLSLSLLKNKDDVIKLKIPISFNENGLDTHLASVIQQALTRATKNASMTYLKLALQPYGSIIMLAEKSGELYNEMQLVNIPFDAMSSTLGDGQLKPAEKLVTVLNDNQTMSIRLCPTATEAESEKWPSASKEEKQQALETLAQQRALSLKKYFQEHQIQAKRLFICAPKIKQKGAGEVKISL